MIYADGEDSIDYIKLEQLEQRVRLVSRQVQDNECGKLAQGMKVAAIYERKGRPQVSSHRLASVHILSHTQFVGMLTDSGATAYYDAQVLSVDRVQHGPGELCVVVLLELGHTRMRT